MDVREALDVVLLDGSTPCSDVDVRVHAADSDRAIESFTTDAHGRFRVEKLQGRLALEIRSPGLWPTRPIVETSTSRTPTKVQVLRTGSVEFSAERADGTPWSGARVDLSCAELGASASQWLAEGKLPRSGALTTDAQGQLRIDGLPRGSYTWAVDDTHGSHASGSIDVPPGALGRGSIESGLVVPTRVHSVPAGALRASTAETPLRVVEGVGVRRAPAGNREAGRAGSLAYS